MLLNIIPICIISVDEFKTLNTHSNKFNSYFCSKDVEAQSGLFICFIIFLVIFLVLLTLLYCSVYKYSRISNSDSTFKSYKRHFIMYLFGHIFTFPYIMNFVHDRHSSLVNRASTLTRLHSLYHVLSHMIDDTHAHPCFALRV